ncbi:NUDIX hydrolase [Actinomycetospora cinnamomea]|uniref:NUDIX hydrolase n=1 Tax=Actinomycetospora cinnamomea TaxID=663609 RepID=UPI000E317466|nr:NUDIX domain-containing protein [Actinomycetospora cinnamomea]
MADTPKHSVSVAGIVIDDRDRVLVIQRRDNGQWEPPGGVLELHETPAAGVAREVFEETGVEAAVDRLTGAYKNMPRGIISLVFRCHPLSTSTTSSDEATEARWVHRSEIPQMMTEAYAIRVSDAFLEGAPAVRAHDGKSLVNSSEPADA